MSIIIGLIELFLICFIIATNGLLIEDGRKPNQGTVRSEGGTTKTNEK